MGEAAATQRLAAPVPESRAGWLVVLAACCGVMVGFSSVLVYTFGVFLKPLSSEFGWSREAISRGFGLAAMAVAVSSPLLGQWLDRYGPRRVVLPAIVLFGLLFGSLSLLTPRLAHLYVVFLLMGLVGNATTQMGYSRAVASWFTDRRGLALSLVMAGVGIGSIINPALAQWLIGQYGWRTAYATLGGAVLVVGLPLAALFVRERPGPEAAGSHRTGASVREGLRSQAFWLLVATLFLSSMGVNGALTHLSPLLTDRGVSAANAALAVAVFGGAGVCGRLLTGFLLDRFFGPTVSMALLAGAAAGILLLANASTVTQGLLAAALIGFGTGGEADVVPYLLTRYFGLRAFSALYGLTWTAYAAAGALGPVLMGRIFDATGSYRGLLLLLAAGTLASAALMLLLPRYPKPAAERQG